MNGMIFKTFANEMKKITRNKRSVLILFAVPALAIMFMTYLMTPGKKTGIYVKSDDSGICSLIADRYGTRYPIADDAGAHDILITVSDTIEIRYDQTQVSAKSMNEAKRVASEIAALLQGSEYADAYMAGEPDLTIRDIATQDEKNRSRCLRSLAYLVMMGVMFGGMNIITISSDSIAGEKERGVYDGIVLSGADMGAWFIGKQLAILTVTVLLFSFETAFGYLGNILLETPLTAAFETALSAGAVAELFISVLGCGLIFTSLFSAISLGFGTVKNASSYSSIVMFAFSFLAALPMVTDKPWTDKIPFANFPVICLKIIGGKSAMPEVLTVLAVSAVIYAAATAAAVRITKINERRR